MPYKYLILNKDLFQPNPLEELLDESIHLIITSPPYFNARNYRLHVSTNGKADIRINTRSKSQLETTVQYSTYLDKMKRVINELYKKLKKGGIMALNIGSITSNGIHLPLPFHFFNLLSELFVWNETIIWDKTHVINFKAYSSRRALSYLNAPISFNYNPNWSHEFIFIFQKKGKTNSNFEKDPHFNREEFITNYSRSIWQIEPIPPTLCRTHPARFPFEIPQHLIKYYSNKGDTIFDPFAGYGTVLIEALRLGRIGVANDIELEFCEIMNRNIEKLERDPEFFKREVQLHRIKTYIIEYRKKNHSDQKIFSLLCKMKYEQDLIKLAFTTYI